VQAMRIWKQVDTLLQNTDLAPQSRLV
jgi:hypothetical protein